VFSGKSFLTNISLWPPKKVFTFLCVCVLCVVNSCKSLATACSWKSSEISLSKTSAILAVSKYRVTTAPTVGLLHMLYQNLWGNAVQVKYLDVFILLWQAICLWVLWEVEAQCLKVGLLCHLHLIIHPSSGFIM